MVQTASTVLANGRATISERLARWLLMALDRVDGNEVALTHEFLATMLGVRRPGVTVAIREFERKGHIAGGRGQITVLDRPGLEIAANGYYGVAEAEYLRLFGRTRAGGFLRLGLKPYSFSACCGGNFRRKFVSISLGRADCS